MATEVKAPDLQKSTESKIPGKQGHLPANHVEKIATIQSGDVKVAGESAEILFTDEEARRVKRKIDYIILPLLCGCYIFSVCLS